jgi:hypothetical protein
MTLGAPPFMVGRDRLGAMAARRPCRPIGFWTGLTELTEEEMTETGIGLAVSSPGRGGGI